MATEIQLLQNRLEELQNKFAEVEEAYQTLVQKYSQIDSLYSMTSSLSTILDFEELLHFTKNIFKNSIKVDHYSIMILDEHAKRLQLQSSFGLPHDLQEADNFLEEGSLLSKVLYRNKVGYLPDLSKSTEAGPYGKGRLESGAFLSIPLIVDEDKRLGLLNLYRREKEAFSTEEREFIARMAEQLAFTLNKVLIYEHTKELSITDDLTGMFNRRYFNQRFESEIQRAKRYNHSLSILMLDLDNFKTYNDINGHIMGDEVLKSVSLILERILRKTDLIARFGGEEFIIMLPEISRDQSRKVANKLRTEVEKTAFENEETLPSGNITVSIGLSFFPDDSREPNKLIRLADDALYRAKSMGRNCVVWHGMNSPQPKEAQVKKRSRKVFQ